MKRSSSMRISTFFTLSHFFIGVTGVGVFALVALYYLYMTGEQACLSSGNDLSFAIAHTIEDQIRPIATGEQGVNEQVGLAIHQIVLDHLVSLPAAQYSIYRPNGDLMIASPAYSMTIGAQGKDIREVRAALETGAGSGIRMGPDGERWVYSATLIQNNAHSYGVFLLGVPFNIAMAPTYHTMTTLALIALGMIGVILLIGLRSSAYLSGPLIRLSRAADRLSQGDLSVRVDVSGPAEVWNLGQSLNEMAARVQHSLDSLQAFVANASHELRTPLTGIKLQMEALLGGAIYETEVAERFLSQIDSEIDRMIRLVNDLLDLSNIEGAGVIRSQPVDLYDLACEVHSFWEARSQQAGVALELNITSTLPPVKGDPYQLRRLVDNLLDNAIKYTPAGGKVTITLRSGASSAWARVEVSDTGIGIPAEHLPHLFDRFYRVETSKAYHPGTGLGLAIARSIALAHGGKIGVESEVGQGSRFWLELPVIA